MKGLDLVPKIAPYHSKLDFLLELVECHDQHRPLNFELEGVRLGAKSKLTRMGVYLAYIPIRGNELGAEDSPLSLETQFFVRIGRVLHSAEMATMGST